MEATPPRSAVVGALSRQSGHSAQVKRDPHVAAILVVRLRESWNADGQVQRAHTLAPFSLSFQTAGARTSGCIQDDA